MRQELWRLRTLTDTGLFRQRRLTGGNQTADTNAAQTGDDSNLNLWIAVMLAAGAVLTGTALYGRKKRYK